MFTTPCGSDLDRYEPYQNSQPKPNTIFFIGGLDWLPNQEGVKWFAQDVWPSIKAKYTAAEFYVAGRNMPNWMNELSGNGVHILGEIEDALGFIAENGIMIVPLFSGSGMRIKIIEGMAMKKAIVSTSIGAEGIAHSDGLNISIANDKQEFIDKLDQMLADDSRVAALGENARKLIESRYNNLTFAEQLIEFYQRAFGI
jgi:glycosyltransferase involved in cell wall biosynthesis